MNFQELGLPANLMQAIEKAGFQTPTEIQAKTIPLVLQGKDLIAQSATGSGKTLAFGAGIIQNAQKGRGLQALVLTPTRELAEQVMQALQKFCRHQLDIQAIYGGVGIGPQIRQLPHADVVVATPGRMLDHLERRTVRLDQVHTLVLDEADRTIDMGFIRDVERILKECPKNRQTMLFSATLAPEIQHIARKHMQTPLTIKAETFVDPKKLTQIYYNVPRNQKLSLLVHLLQKETTGLVMIFCNTRRITDFVTKALRQNSIEATAIHGGLTQNKRSNTLERFHSQRTQVLVCTDVASRGLDIPNVSHIYNYDLPADPKQYIHRIGRTARAGKEGRVINLLSPEDHEAFYLVQREYDVNIRKEITPATPRISIPQREEGGRGTGGRFGARPGPRRFERSDRDSRPSRSSGPRRFDRPPARAPRWGSR